MGVSESKSVTLVITHQCNLRCIYCYEKHKDNKRMSLEKAIEIVDYELTLDDGISDVEIDFFGGEPLLEFDLIKAVVEYAKSRTYPKKYIFFITTNGVLLNDERKKWFRENTEYIQLGLSLDGNKAMHDYNRSNSFDKIDLNFFKETYPEQDVKMTISKETLNTLYDGVLFCESMGFDVSCNLAYGIDWQDPALEAIFERELNKLINHYLEHPEIKPCALLDIKRLKGVPVENKDALRHCGAGWAMKSYDWNGKFYPCQHFLPISIGEEAAEKALSIDFTNQALDVSLLNNECQNCVLKNVCPSCYGENFSATGDINKKDLSMCRLNKIQFKALAYFAANGFKKGMFDNIPNAELSLILKGALKVNSEIKL